MATNSHAGHGAALLQRCDQPLSQRWSTSATMPIRCSTAVVISEMQTDRCLPLLQTKPRATSTRKPGLECWEASRRRSSMHVQTSLMIFSYFCCGTCLACSPHGCRDALAQSCHRCLGDISYQLCERCPRWSALGEHPAVEKCLVRSTSRTGVRQGFCSWLGPCRCNLGDFCILRNRSRISAQPILH